MLISATDVLIRIGIAIACGLFIGLERQMTGHVVGIKTTILTSFGSCVFVLFSFLSGDEDTTRIAAQVVTGVGFLCSSIIVKNGITVSGLNTSATIWCTAAIGILSSLGYWQVSAIVTATLILTNLVFYPIAAKIPVLRKFDDETEERIYKLYVSCHPDKAFEVRKVLVDKLSETNFILTGIEIKEGEIAKTTLKVTLSYIGKIENASLESFVRDLSSDNDILGVNWKLS